MRDEMAETLGFFRAEWRSLLAAFLFLSPPIVLVALVAAWLVTA